MDKYNKVWWQRHYPSIENALKDDYKPLIAAFMRGETVENSSGDVCDFLDFEDTTQRDYQVKPSMVKSVEAERGIAFKLPLGAEYYTPSTDKRDLHYTKYTWQFDGIDLRLLERGLVYLTSDKAIARAKAMLGEAPCME